MRIKGSLAKSLLVALAMSLIPVAGVSAETVTSGATCKTYNQKIVFKNKTYTCIKSGKKLIWNAGVAIVKPVSSPTPTPTHKSGVPTQGMDCIHNSPDVVGYDSSWNYVDLMCNQFDDRYFPRPGNQKPFLVDPKTGERVQPILSIPTSSADDILYHPILERSFNQILQLPDVTSTAKIQFIVDPKFPPRVVAGIEAAANVVIAKFGNLIPVNLPIIEVLSTTSEFELNAYQSNPYLASTLLQNSGSSQSRDNAYNNKFNVSAGAFPVWPEGVISAYGVVYRNASNNNDPGFFDYAVGAHETMHIIQLAVSQGKASGFLPVWFLEGQATQFGNLYETSNETISQALAVANSFPFPQGSNDLTTLETYTGMDCCGLAYSRGQAATNFLTGKFGWEKVLKFTKSSDTYSDWKTAFQAIFDEPVSQFYTAVQPFIAWMKNVIQP